MSLFARSFLVLSLSGLALLAGCSASHSVTTDAGPFAVDAPSTDAMCSGASSLLCLYACGGDAGAPPICVSGAWQCPPGTTDINACPPGCFGPPPSADCTCVGSTWSCPSMLCPPDINPWASPGTECSVEGATCTNGNTDPCGAFLACECEEGHWSCAFAEPDPVCSCGREPSAGDRCNEEGASCGECCPTPGGTGWQAMTCVGGHWEHAGCPELVCPPLPGYCPVDRAAALGTACSTEGQSCGDGCCSTAFECQGGVWVPGPELDCICDPTSTFDCGSGSCRRGQACMSSCGPDDGIEHSCAEISDGCTSCDCITTPPGYTCESRGGHVFLSMSGFCG